MLEDLSNIELTGIIIGVGIILLIILYFIEEYIIKRVAKIFNIDVHALPKLLKWPVLVTVGLIVLFAGLQPLEIIEPYIHIVRNTLITIGVLIWLYAFVRIGNTIIEELITKKIDESLGPIAENVWDIVILIGSIGIIFSTWGINITPLLASAGVFGIIIGFAARDTIANLFGSIALYVDKTFEKGDYIVIDDETQGYVTDVSIRSTEVRTLEGDKVALPNSELNNTIIRNKSQPQPAHRVTTSIGVSYNTDLQHVKTIIENIIDSVEMINNNPSPQIHIRDFADSSIHVEILVWIDDPSQKLRVEDDINTRIKQRFNEENIKIPFPQRDISIDTENNK